MIIFVENILNRFVRFGKMDSYLKQAIRQDGSSFHTAPEKRGFYAMPYKFQEMFLISSLEDTQKDIFPKRPKFPEPELTRTPMAEDPAWQKYYKDVADFDARIENIKHNLIRHSFTLRDSDLIWHHFTELPPNLIFGRNDAWVLSDVSAYKKGIGKCIAVYNKETQSHRGHFGRGYRSFDRDEFEVFIPAGTIK